MAKKDLKTALEDLTESLAALEHERWAHWQRYVHSQCVHLVDGSLLIPERLVKRWEGQIKTPYMELTNEERESDREQVRRSLHLIMESLNLDDPQE